MEYSGAGGKLIHEKNQKQKISWHCPFKFFVFNFKPKIAEFTQLEKSTADIKLYSPFGLNSWWKAKFSVGKRRACLLKVC